MNSLRSGLKLSVSGEVVVFISTSWGHKPWGGTLFLILPHNPLSIVMYVFSPPVKPWISAESLHKDQLCNRISGKLFFGVSRNLPLEMLVFLSGHCNCPGPWCKSCLLHTLPSYGLNAQPWIPRHPPWKLTGDHPACTLRSFSGSVTCSQAIN